MTVARGPRRHAHRGSVVAIGLALDRAAIGEAEARARVMTWWAPGCEVRAVDGLWIVRLPGARRIDAATAPGAPLVAHGGVSLGLPLAPAELAALAAPTGAVVLARGGELVAVRPGEGEPVDPAGWIEAASLEVVEVASLGAPRVVVAAPVAAASVRRSAMGVGDADPQAAAVRAALVGGIGVAIPASAVGPARGAAAGKGGAGGVGGKGVGAAGGASAGRAPWWARVVDGLFNRRGPAKGLPTSGGTATGTDTGTGSGAGPGAATSMPPPPPPLPQAPSWLDRLRARASQAIWRSALGDVIGRRHADYLREMLEMFDRGDLEQALRRAIPLGSGADPASREPVRLVLGLPTPRTLLTPSMSQPARGTTLPVADQIMEILRERYRAARDRLIRDGRFDEAAFVIADLLRDPEAAVAMLEQHDRLRLAAELAEARELAPGLVIRQWFLVGDVERALAIAWRTGAFADALARTARGPLADRLRMAWATALAGAGDYLAAVDTAARLDAPAGDSEAAIDRWIELGIAGGGVAAARLWIRRLARPAAGFDDVRAAVLPILARDDADALGERIAIGQELLAATADPRVATLARAAVRGLLADLGRGVDGEPATLLQRLVRVAADPALKADLPAIGTLPRRDALVDRAAPVVHRLGRGDTGASAIRDLAMVPGGRLLVALGELGVRLLTGDGRVLASWDEPADALVLADPGTHAIALARRGQGHRLARIDLARRTARPWCEAELDAWAPTFDGARWLIARGRDLLAVDTGRDDLRATWGVAAEDGETWSSLTRDGDRWGAVAGDLGSAELWIHERFTLRGREAIRPAHPAGRTGIGVGLGVLPDPGAGAPWIVGSLEQGAVAGLKAWVGQALIAPGWRIELDPSGWAALAGASGWSHLVGVQAASRCVAAIAAVEDWGRIVEVFYLPTRRAIARIALAGASDLAVRFCGFDLCVGDDRGRAIVLDLRTGALRRDLRVR